VVVTTGAAVAFGLGAGAGTTFGAGGTTLAGTGAGLTFFGSSNFTSGLGYEYLYLFRKVKFNSEFISFFLLTLWS
jgi:hypothetical protein